jgi:N-acetylmuramoyl-L-alanine amidase
MTYFAMLMSVFISLGVTSGVTQNTPTVSPAPMHFEHLRRIVVDPGHGGQNKGCLGVDGHYEKTVVLQISQRIERILWTETNALPMMTRSDDTFLSLGERTRLANLWQGDVFLSLHLNADAYGKGFGVETWFLGADTAHAEAAALVKREEASYGQFKNLKAFENSRAEAILRDAALGQSQAGSEVLAISVGDALKTGTKATYRGVKQAPFGVLKHAEMPAIVVEAGFLSHTKEGIRLMDPAYQERIARAIVKGLIAYDSRIGRMARLSTAQAH